MPTLKDYPVTVAFSDADAEYIATTPPFPLLSGLGATPAEAVSELHVALEAALESLAEAGEAAPAPPRPPSGYSGNLRVRLPASVHAALARAADDDGVSLNTYIVTRLSHALGAGGRAV